MLLPSIVTTVSIAVLVRPPKEIVRPAVVLRVPIPRQDATEWCWAAVGLGIARAYGTDGGRTQCEHAAGILRRECCQKDVDCNEPHELPPSLGSHYDRSTDLKDDRTLAFVKAQIDRRQPIAVRIHRRSAGSGHAVVIAGYGTIDNQSALWIWDPEDGGCQPWKLSAFRDTYEYLGFWHISYLTTGGTVEEEDQPC